MNEAAAACRYANHFSIGHNALEFVFEFAQVYRDSSSIQPHTRIVTLPHYANALSQTLCESLERYERSYGLIPPMTAVDSSVVVNHPVHAAVDLEHWRPAMPDRPDRPDDTPSEGPDYEPSWYREPPRRKPPRDYDQKPYEGEPYPSGGESWQRPEGYGKPVDELATLRSKLEDRQTELSSLTKQRDTLKQDIEGLELAVTELKQIVAAYDQASKDLKKEKQELDLYVATKTPMLEVAVKDKKAKIHRIIDGVDCDIREARERLKQLEQEAKAAEKDVASATQYEEQEQASYTALKDTYKQIDAKLKQLKALRDTIEKDYDEKNKVAAMYFLMKELGAELSTIRILPKEELERELYAAWNRLKKAKNRLREASARQDAAKEAVAKAKKTLETLTTNRRRTILDLIAQYCGEPAN